MVPATSLGPPAVAATGQRLDRSRLAAQVGRPRERRASHSGCPRCLVRVQIGSMIKGTVMDMRSHRTAPGYLVGVRTRPDDITVRVMGRTCRSHSASSMQQD